MVRVKAPPFLLQHLEALPAESGAEAIRIAAEHPLDVIILDVRMPEVDGMECSPFKGFCMKVSNVHSYLDLMRSIQQFLHLRIKWFEKVTSQILAPQGAP